MATYGSLRSKKPIAEDPSAFHGLEQAIFILEKLCDGEQKAIIARQLHDDKQLLETWTIFLKDNKWVSYDSTSHKWGLTDKGCLRIDNIRSVL
jgi:hypothetical protein